jgi:CubicO group peptidase (beta-lactamase class C family)
MRRPHVRATSSKWLPLVAVGLLLSACTGASVTAPSPTLTTTSAAVITAPPTTAKPTTDVSKKARSQAVLDGAIKASAPGCSAAVGSLGNVVWTGVRGLSNTTVGDVITPDTVFDIGSVSKQFTATAILLLAGAGKLTLDDPLSQHARELPPWAAGVTIGQLMHQTSGIPDYLGILQSKGFQYSDRTTEEQALQLLTTVTALEFPPGSQFRYSNSNYLLLGDIVRRVSGQPLPEFLGEQVFQPLGLAMIVDPVGKIPNKAVSYAKTDDGGYRVADSLWEQIGDGAIQTTPSQLVRWADNYRTGQVGGPQLLDAQTAGAVETTPGGPDRYGAGIYVAGNGTLEHDGSWEGFVTAFRISKDRLTSLAISCNTDKQDPNALADALAALWM